jgi:hypothetical protein
MSERIFENLKRKGAVSEGFEGYYGKFFGTLLQSSVIGHIYHLQTRKYSKHIALGSFYDSIVGLTDSLIESYQGANSVIVDGYENTLQKGVDPLEYFKSLKNYILAQKIVLFPSSPQNTNLLNIVDEIVTLIDSTLYKLTFLE